MNKISLPPCCTHHKFDQSSTDRNRFSNEQYIARCDGRSLPSIWQRLHRTPTKASRRRFRYDNEIDFPKNNLDFRLRTCYNHAEETFAPKARIVVQPVTISQKANQFHSYSTPNYSVKIINGNRREHSNEATKGQHIASDHFANGKHGYSRVTAGAIPVD